MTTTTLASPLNPDHELGQLFEHALAYSAASRAPNTRRAYYSQWRGFVAWCAAVGLRPLPEFEAWLEDIGLWKNGMLTERAGDASFFLSR